MRGDLGAWRARWQVLWPAPLQEPKTLFLAGLIVVCMAATFTTAVVSTHAGLRWQCGIVTVLLVGLLVLFLRGLSVERTLKLSSWLAVLHIGGEALQINQVHASALVWVALLPVTHFHLRGRRAGWHWTLVALGVVVAVALLGLWLGDALGSLFGLVQAPTSLSEYLLATLAITIVPWLYTHRNEKILAARQRHQRELEAQQSELERTQKMQEQFIASVSHELRTPMNAILGLNAVLLERVQDRPQARKVLQYTRQSADHLMTVINDVLDHSLLGAGPIQARPERFALHETVRTAFELFAPRLEDGRVQYLCEIDPDVPVWVETDRHRLTQVLVNLLANAVKFTEQGRIRLQVLARAGGVEFAVEDTGIGIPAQQQQYIFERFAQADESIQKRYGGTGLGLTISQRLVQLLGGRLQLRSRQGQGTRFWFCLPLQAVQPPAGTASDRPPVDLQSPQPQRFLVVDDHPVNRLLVRQVLLRQWPQAEVVEAVDGRQALQNLQAQAAFDLVLMDMVMPVMDGIEATRAIRADARPALRQTPVLGLTANVSTGDLQRFEQAGLDGLLLKPFEVLRLRQEVERLTARQRHAECAA